MKRCKPISFYQQAELTTNKYWAIYSSNAFLRLADHQPILRAYNKILSYQSHKMVMEIHKEEQPVLLLNSCPTERKEKARKGFVQMLKGKLDLRQRRIGLSIKDFTPQRTNAPLQEDWGDFI